MAELMAVEIDNAYDADRILAEMNRIDAEHAQDSDGAGAIAGLLIMNPSMQSTLGASSLRASGDEISASLSDCGIEEGFVFSLAAMLEADAAALFLVVRKSQTGKVLEGLSGFPGRVLRSSFSVDRIPRLQNALSRVGTAPRAS